MAENTRKVIGIDPASGKGSYVFAPGIVDPNPEIAAKGPGIDRNMKPSELRALLPSNLDSTRKVATPFEVDSCLVCWDAPLTGLQDPDALVEEKPSTGDDKNKDAESLTTRPIERSGKDSKYPSIAEASKAAGVSVLGFSGLSHWVISRNVLGLPRVGRFDTEYKKLPLYPVFTKNELTHHDWAVTEVHPTLAVYLWLADRSPDDRPYWHQYKGQGKDSDVVAAVMEMWDTLCKRFGRYLATPISPPNSEDAFDARVAWLLGFLWLNSEEVELVGSEKDGSFLLPKGACNSD